jgi:small conductance mechanosensitive channel
MEFSKILEEWGTLISVGSILLAAIVLRLVLRIASKRIVSTVVSGVNRASKSKRLDSIVADQRLTLRTRTIATVFDNFTSWGIAITALVMILSELGVNVGALIAVTTILGAAIGFGAQSLV